MSAWWQTAVIYQVYPRSFQDSNGDGIGDLEGIRSRIDYLTWLGVDAVWLSPIYPSPMVDFGYDIADYCGIDPMFGTLDQFDRLLADLHARGIRVIMDFVPNHTSDQHPWFRESRASRDSPRRGWYVWHDGQPQGGYPNNWIDQSGAPAWAYDEATGQYYYHRFTPEQPDLNWYNPDVAAAMEDVLRFWLDRGVDGFRVDASTNLVEDALLRDDPPYPLVSEGQPEVLHVFTSDRPETHQCIGHFREVADRYPDKVLIGEAHLPIARLMQYYGEARGELGFHIPFNFLAISTPWNARSIAAAIDQYFMLLPPHDWPNWVLGNHDEDRVASRIGLAQARVAAMLALTQRGTPFIYNGEELGLENLNLPEGQSLDPAGRAGGRSRDAERGRMPWDGSTASAFTTGKPWLPLPGNAAEVSVSAQRDDQRSMLTLYRRLLALRRGERALQTGDCLPVPDRGTVLSYRRADNDRAFQISLNFGAEPQAITLDRSGRIVLSTHLDREEDVSDSVRLRGNEGVVIALTRS